MKEEIIGFITDNLIYSSNLETINADDNLLETGLIDSISLIKLVSFIEETYHFKVKPEDMVIEYFQSVNALVNYINTVK